jgi:hypothetical protein
MNRPTTYWYVQEYKYLRTIPCAAAVTACGSLSLLQFRDDAARLGGGIYLSKSVRYFGNRKGFGANSQQGSM